MHQVGNPAGRLVTFRVVPPVDDANAEAAARALRAAVTAIPGPVLICSDVSEARTFSDRTVQQFVSLMKADNPKVERSAFLLDPGAATFALQLERMVREASSPARRTFREARALTEWLLPLLTPQEAEALEAFLLPRERRGPPRPRPRKSGRS
jgi:hypothetical protein